MMKSLFSLAPSAVEVEIYLNPSDNRQFVDVNINPGTNRKERTEKFPLYADGESVTGKVSIIFQSLYLPNLINLNIGAHQSQRRQEAGTCRN
jgi:hypothetical protein